MPPKGGRFRREIASQREGKWDGQPFERHLRFTDRLQKRGDLWNLLASARPIPAE